MRHLRYRLMLLICCFFTISLNGMAQDSPTPFPPLPPIDKTQYPTIAALEQLIIPANDPIDLAQRIHGLNEFPTSPVSVPVRSVGERETFTVTNSATNVNFAVQAELRGIGEHSYIWVDVRSNISVDMAQAFAEQFDREVVLPTRELWGSEANPGIDGDPRIYLLFTRDLNPNVGAYFTSRNVFPATIVSDSNEHEMLIFNLSQLPTNILNPRVLSLAAHEFQHMIRLNLDTNESTWLNEGLSMFTERYLGYNSGQLQATRFLQMPQTQLMIWGAGKTTAEQYGAAFLFVSYFYERYGLEALQRLSESPADGFQAFDAVFREMEEPGVERFFADWVLANALQMPEIGYGYTILWANLPVPPPVATISTYPYLSSGTANQYTAEYYWLTNLQDMKALDISFANPPTVKLLSTTALSGTYFWYAVPADFSDSILTHAFDLSEVDSATLQYRAWYDIERFWDYAYVMVSSDHGEHWVVLDPPSGNDDNPYKKAYGRGYTGKSDGWIEEQISLDAYRGGEIWLRFEMITDDAFNQPGIALDELSIPEIGYTADFEQGDDGWDASGWIRTDNRLPQRVWIQAVQFTSEGIRIARWLASDANQWTLELEPDVEQVLLVIAPFAPITREPMPYTLSIAAQ